MSLSQTSYLVRMRSTDLYMKRIAREDRSFVAFHILRNRANGRKLVEEANVARAPDIVVPYITSSCLSSSPCSWKRRRRRRTISFAKRRSLAKISLGTRAIFRTSSYVKRKENNKIVFVAGRESLAYLFTYGFSDAYSTPPLPVSSLSVGDTRVSLSGALSVGAIRDTRATDGERDGENITPGYSREQGATVRVLPNPGKITA